jgi:putative transposase
LTGAIRVFSDAVQLPRLGRLRLHEHDFIPTDAKVLSATVSEQAGRWFVSVQVEEEQEKPTPTATTAVGVDLGIKTLATCSDGTTFANPRALKQAQKRLRRLERQKSRRKLGGKTRQKTCHALAKQHARVANIRKDAAHKLTNYLSKNHALIALENLHVAGMLKNHPLAQAVSDSNFGEIRRQLEYKAARTGAYLVTVDRFYPSSKTCSACGWIDKDLDLKSRTFICEACGLVIGRDLNAALNLLQEALRTTGSFSESHASGQGGSGTVNGPGETALGEGGTNHQGGLSTSV